MLAMLALVPLTTGLVAGTIMPAGTAHGDPVTGNNPVSTTNVTGSWQTGDLHVHTFESDDAQNSLKNVLDNGLNKYGLDWIAITDHLRTSKRDADGNVIKNGPIPMSLGMNEYQVPQIKKLQEEGNYAGKTIFSGFEWDMPTHEHVGVGILTNEPNSTEALEAAKEFEYRFTNRDANMFDAEDVAKWNAEGARAYSTHQDALTAIEWLSTHYPMTSYAMINHPSRGKNKYTIADFRDFNDLAPKWSSVLKVCSATRWNRIAAGITPLTIHRIQPPMTATSTAHMAVSITWLPKWAVYGMHCLERDAISGIMATRTIISKRLTRIPAVISRASMPKPMLG